MNVVKTWISHKYYIPYIYCLCVQYLIMCEMLFTHSIDYHIVNTPTYTVTPHMKYNTDHWAAGKKRLSLCNGPISKQSAPACCSETRWLRQREGRIRLWVCGVFGSRQSSDRVSSLSPHHSRAPPGHMLWQEVLSVLYRVYQRQQQALSNLQERWHLQLPRWGFETNNAHTGSSL